MRLGGLGHVVGSGRPHPLLRQLERQVAAAAALCHVLLVCPDGVYSVLGRGILVGAEWGRGDVMDT